MWRAEIVTSEGCCGSKQRVELWSQIKTFLYEITRSDGNFEICFDMRDLPRDVTHHNELMPSVDTKPKRITISLSQDRVVLLVTMFATMAIVTRKTHRDMGVLLAFQFGSICLGTIYVFETGAGQALSIIKAEMETSTHV